MPSTGSSINHLQFAAQKESANVCRLALQIAVSEILGTAMLMFIGCTCYDGRYGSVWTFPMAIVTVIHIFGPTSGAHVNPGATIVAFMLGQLSYTLVFVYWGAQITGAFIGYILYHEISLIDVDPINLIGVEWQSMCITKPFETSTAGQTFGLELLVSFVFFLATAARFDPNNKLLKGSESIKMGFITYGLYFSMRESTMLSMNSARSLPPAVLEKDYEGHWIYWIAPNLAALLAGGIYRLCLTIRALVEPEKSED